MSNKYLEKIASEAATATVGLRGIAARRGAYTRGKARMPTHLAKAAEEVSEQHYGRNAAIGAGLGAVAGVANPYGMTAYLAHEGARGMRDHSKNMGRLESAKKYNRYMREVRLEALKRLVVPGAAAGAAIAAGATGLNHLRHKAMDKQAGFFGEALDAGHAVAMGTGQFTKSIHGDLLGSKIQKHVAKATDITNNKQALNDLAKKTDEELYAMTPEKDHEALRSLMQRRTASRFLAGSGASGATYYMLNKPSDNYNGHMYPNQYNV